MTKVSKYHHGESSYANGLCRCKICCEANTQRARRERKVRQLRLIADPTLAEHGKKSTYTNWGCRCEECTEANNKACRDYKRAKVTAGA